MEGGAIKDTFPASRVKKMYLLLAMPQMVPQVRAKGREFVNQVTVLFPDNYIIDKKTNATPDIFILDANLTFVFHYRLNFE